MQLDIEQLKKRLDRKIATAGIDSSRCDVCGRGIGVKTDRSRPSL
jgi:hypothetical protein